VSLAFIILLSTGAFAADERRPRPLSASTTVKPLSTVSVLELEVIVPEEQIAADERQALEGPGPLRFAQPNDVKITPQNNGSWERLADGSRLWRLRIHSPGSTDLNFGFSEFRLPPGATLYIVAEADGFFQGPFTSHDNEAHGEFWSPVVPGERAVLELWVPPDAVFEPILQLKRIGSGYRGHFFRSPPKQGSCNIDVVCPEGDPWRNEIRSVGRYSVGGMYLCSGSLIMDVPASMTPYFLSAHHCGVDSSNDQTVVVYWNYESVNCGDLSGGSLSQNQSGAIFRASREDNDVLLMELEETPDPSFQVYFAGWDARPSVIPGSSVGIHHPGGDEKAISFNDDPLTIRPNCVVGGTASDTHWRVDNWEQGTTEAGSSGSGLWDPATKRVVGYLTGGSASCWNPGGSDCYGRFAIGWEGPDPASRMKDWLDPQSTGTLFVDGKDPNVSCNVGYDDGTAETAAFFGGGQAGNPDYMFAVRFALDDFEFVPGLAQVAGFCASNQITFPGGPWPNEVFIYPDSEGLPDDSTVLGQGTVVTGDGSVGQWYDVMLAQPVTLDGDFWLTLRGDPQWSGEDFNMEADQTSPTGNSYLSASGVLNLLVAQDNFMLRALLEELTDVVFIDGFEQGGTWAWSDTIGGDNPSGHSFCETGPALDPQCHACVETVCSVDPFCCATYWDRLCVDQVENSCFITCR
jgi:hypothetical protein